MFTCASCQVVACRTKDRDDLPKNCPMRLPEMKTAMQKYHDDPQLELFHKTSAIIEGTGFGIWPRALETINFCKAMGYKKIGVAFCYGLRKEAKAFCAMVRQHGLEAVSVVCCAGGMEKREFGVRQDQYIHPENDRESMCNPIGQADMLRAAGTDFNVAIGLCVGHDALFLKNSHVLATVLIAKDRVYDHNPIAALRCPLEETTPTT